MRQILHLLLEDVIFSFKDDGILRKDLVVKFETRESVTVLRTIL